MRRIDFLQKIKNLTCKVLKEIGSRDIIKRHTFQLKLDDMQTDFCLSICIYTIFSNHLADSWFVVLISSRYPEKKRIAGYTRSTHQEMDENIYEPPKADLRKEDEVLSSYLFFPSSTLKLTILFFATFGIYTIYWFYKNWTIQQNHMDKKIHPALRSLFYIFFTHSLFSKIGESALAKKIHMKWSTSLLATFFVIITIINNILDRISMNTENVGPADILGIATMFAMLMPLYYIQNIANQINSDPKGNLNSSFSIYNYIFIGIGSILWLLTIVGLFIE